MNDQVYREESASILLRTPAHGRGVEALHGILLLEVEDLPQQDACHALGRPGIGALHRNDLHQPHHKLGGGERGSAAALLFSLQGRRIKALTCVGCCSRRSE